MGVLEDFTATMRNVAQMQAGRGQRTAETGRGTREALAMLQAQFNQMAQAGREKREAGLGRTHETELLGTQLKAEKESDIRGILAQNLQTQETNEAAMSRLLKQLGSQDELARMAEAGATTRHKETEGNRIIAAKIAAGRLDLMSAAEKYDWAVGQVEKSYGEKMFDWEWKKENADELADQFREHFLYLHKDTDLTEVERATERFRQSLLNPHLTEEIIPPGDISAEIQDTEITSIGERNELLDVIERYKNTLEQWTPSPQAKAAEADPFLMGLGSGTGQLFSGMIAGKETNPKKLELNTLWNEAQTATSLTVLQDILRQVKELAAGMGISEEKIRQKAYAEKWGGTEYKSPSGF